LISIYKSLIRANWLGLIFLYFFTSFLFNFFNDEFVQTDELYNDFLEAQYSEKYEGYEEFGDDLEDLKFLEENDDISSQDILFEAFYILLEIIVTIPVLAMLFISGFFLTKELSTIQYGLVFKAVLISSFIFLFEIAIRSLYFSLIDTNYSFEEITAFKPFHLSSIVDSEHINEWLMPVINIINVYDFAFLFSFSYLISFMARKNIWTVFGLSGITYMVSIVLWKLFLLYLLKLL